MRNAAEPNGHEEHWDKTRTLSAVTATVLILLLAAFYATTLLNMREIGQQIDLIKDHPYPVTVAAGQVETSLGQLQTLAERLAYVRTDQAIDSVERSFDAIDGDLSERIAFIKDRTLTGSDYADELRNGYDELRVAQAELLSLCRDETVSDESIDAFVEKRIDPLIADLLGWNNAVLDGASSMFDTLYDVVGSVIFKTIMSASIIMAAVLVALGIYLAVLRRKRLLRLKLQRNLEEALASAQEANAAKTQFLSNMSHDIRTPLNAIIGLTAIAGTHLEDPLRVKECLGKITVSSRHLLGLINDVLDMSMIENGRIALNCETFSFPELVNGFVTIIQPQAKAKQLTLDVVVGNVDKETVIGDPMRVNQILLNLVGNAIKYTPAGGTVRVKIAELPTDEEDKLTFRFAVEDDGIGMTQEFANKIFDPFEREKNSMTSRVEGAGLGMSITKNIVDMMGGTIEVESKVGVGSKFTVEVPLMVAKTDDEEFAPIDLAEARVLLVDDDPDICESTLDMLASIGISGDQALSGEEAVELVVGAHRAGRDYHTIIVDWVMPGMDGVETVRRIREAIGDETPIVLLSAYDWSEVEEEALEAGVTAFLSKPLFKSKLYFAMKSVCGEGEPIDYIMEHEQAPDCSGKRVLLVEDNELNVEIALEVIGRTGAEVDCAWDGVEAVEKVREAPVGYYQLIFMDVQMPRMDGLEAARTICDEAKRDGRARPPIVAMSANAFTEDRRQAMEAGMDGYLTKPIDFTEVERILKRALL
ncbi:response regulator [Raoultibacter phocaeensis]|uniref:response regulator n=1 Tax=Raoultibacter phocaeensis TaxID=2479841 RepID=UPI00111BC73E|nr:response regulator [Raoultibacter phocaeensis]